MLLGGMMTSTAVLEREPEVQSRTEVPVATPTDIETPYEKRERLRQQVRALGTNPFAVESIEGDCALQISQQIADLSSWLIMTPKSREQYRLPGRNRVNVTI